MRGQCSVKPLSGWMSTGPGGFGFALSTSDGRVWFLVDKVPVFGAEFGPETPMPVPVRLVCDLVGDDGGQVVVVAPRLGVEAEDGTTRFRVRRDQLEPIET